MSLREKYFIKDTRIWTLIPTIKVATAYKDYKKPFVIEFWFLCFFCEFVFARSLGLIENCTN